MYKDAFTLPGLVENIMFQFTKIGFREYLNEKLPKTPNYHYLTNIEEKIQNYIQQDIKAGRKIDDIITKEEVIQLFKKQNHVCYYFWFKGTAYNWSLDRIDCNKAHISGNCIIACIEGNRQRSTIFIGKFYRRKAFIRFAKSHPMMYLIDENNKKVCLL